MITRLARLEDLPAWLQLRRALWPDDDGHDAEAAAILASDRTATWVAEDGGRLIGFAEVSLRESAPGCATRPVGYLEGWFVAPDSRGHGIGRKLVDAAEAWAARRGATEFASDAELDNDASIAAHGALGFSEVERIVCFRKPLTG